MTQHRPLDEVIPRELSKDAKLFNVDATMIVNFFGRPAVYLPVAVADSPAGRETVYKLPLGKKTLMGIYVSGNTVLRDFYTRVAEREYTVSKETLAGKVMFSGKGTLKVLDERVGAGEIVIEPTGETARESNCHCTRRWYVWSFIGTEDCNCPGGRPGLVELE